tara:strand:- start:72 stop:383 length:312 start_codon:yes stop_codon:yes gene_type:complete
MKYIKQQSTGKIVYRDQPHNEKSLGNAVIETGIVKSDLEVVESDWTDDKWNTVTKNQLSYDEKRKIEYFDIEEQLDMQYWDLVNGTTKWKDHISKVKLDITKE